MDAKKPRVLLIGIDGGDWRNILYGIEKGNLPFIKKLIEKGISGDLRSLIPPTTFPVWACFAVSQNPGKIGEFGYVKKVKGEYKTEVRTENLFLQITPFWKKLNEKNIKVGIANIPGSYPPTKADEFMVCFGDSYHIPKGLTYPSKLEDEIINKIGKLEYETNYSYFNKPLDEQLKESINYLKNRMKLNKFLLKEYKSKIDFFMTVFFPDRLQHFIIDKEKLMEYYSELDKEIGELIKLYKPDYVFVISDHGGGEVKKEFYVNEFLIKNDYLKLKKKKKFLNKIGINRENLQKIISKLKIDSKIIRTLPRNFLEVKLKKAIPSKRILIDDAKINWEKTTAFCFNDCGGIFINLKEREAEGIVDKQDYEKMRDKIIEDLRNIKDPETNEKIKIEVYKREEIYKGRYVEEAPDIIYAFENWDYVPKTSLPGEIFLKPRDPGNHKLYGIFIAAGKKIKKGKIENAELIDIAPTILKIFNIEKPEYYDGKVLDIFL